MAASELSLGGSLEVPCVQELAKQSLKAVPSRYVRSDQDFVDVSSSADPTSLRELPVIDMQRLLSAGSSLDSMDSELEKLHNACKEWGFFQLINHGVSRGLVEKVKVEIEELFNLPMEEKKKLWQQEGELEGFGQAFVMSEEQKLEWADHFFLVMRPIRKRKPHLLPGLPLPLRDDLEAYSAETRDLGMKILGFMAKVLKMKSQEMRELFDDGMQTMRMLYYPPCPQPELVVGLNAHSDAGGLSILLQVNDTQGLQIKKDGKWITVKPLPDTFIVNIGNILEIATNGIYQSVEHRAIVNSEKERISFAVFLSANPDGYLSPAPSLVTAEAPAQFKRIGVVDYFKGFFSRENLGKSYLDTLRINQGQSD
ncbi:protein SRG1-like [Diospyros lotus]|uniref:protein SRG1-like n=1 Tax=Diospyros lotus TaxID=55363 RepID=UPI0022510B67|nr:protein SRG1-like [Diospyros lotus]